MKRFVQLFCLFSFAVIFIMGCSAQRNASAPSASSWKNGVKGVWTLRSIEKEGFPNGASVKSIFDEAPMECFQNSEWNLTASGKGTITFSQEGTSCAPGAVREIFWSIFKASDMNDAYFQFKKIMPGDKAKDVTAGYRLELVSAMDGSMVMRMSIDAGGSTNSYLIFNFNQ